MKKTLYFKNDPSDIPCVVSALNICLNGGLNGNASDADLSNAAGGLISFK